MLCSPKNDSYLTFPWINAKIGLYILCLPAAGGPVPNSRYILFDERRGRSSKTPAPFAATDVPRTNGDRRSSSSYRGHDSPPRDPTITTRLILRGALRRPLSHSPWKGGWFPPPSSGCGMHSGGALTTPGLSIWAGR